MSYKLKDEIRILLIEDDASDVELMEAYLAEVPSFRCQLTSVSNLQDASTVSKLENFSIVIMDLGLRRTRGIETYRAFKMLQMELPVIIATGLDDEETGLQAIHEGAQDYLVKGQFDGKSVVQAIRYALARYQIEKELQSSEDRFSRLINDNADGMMVLSNNNEIRFLNPAAKMLLENNLKESSTIFEHKIPMNRITEIELLNKNGEKCFLECKSSTIL